MSDAGSASPSDNSDSDAGFTSAGESQSTSDTSGSMPLWQRGFYMLGFGIFAYMTFWVLIVMAILQLIVVAIDKKPNEDLKRFARNTVQYLWQLLAFMVFATDDRPFPFGPFPNVPE
jgi:hypothetical protein